MRRPLVLVSVMLFLVMAVVGCGKGGSTAPEPAKPAETKNEAPIKIGQIVHLTGSNVEAAGYEKLGAELAVEEINAAGGVNGRKLQIVIEDGKSANPGCVAALQKLLEDKEIPLIIGPSPSTQVTAMLPTIKEAKVPVATGGTNYGLTHSDNGWVFRFRPHDGMSAKVMAKFVVEDLKNTKVAIVHGTDAFGNGGRDMVTAALKDLGVTPVADIGFNNDEKDFTAVISALKKSGAEAIVSYIAMSPDVGILARQMKQQGLKVDWVGSASVVAVAGRQLAGDALYGTYSVSDFHVDANAKAKTFAEAYKKKTGREPDFYSAWAYDTVYAYAEAMKKAPDLKPENLRQALLSIKGFQGVEGEYNFDQNGDGLDSYNVVQNDNDKIKLVKTIKVQR